MDATTRRAFAVGIGVVGLVLLAIGLFLGFGGVSKNGINCGSAFGPSDHDANVAELTGAINADSIGADYSSRGYAGDCKDATSSRKTVAVALVIPGAALTGLAAIGGLMLASDAQARRERAASAA